MLPGRHCLFLCSQLPLKELRVQGQGKEGEEVEGEEGLNLTLRCVEA